MIMNQGFIAFIEQDMIYLLAGYPLKEIGLSLVFLTIISMYFFITFPKDRGFAAMMSIFVATLLAGFIYNGNWTETPTVSDISLQQKETYEVTEYALTDKMTNTNSNFTIAHDTKELQVVEVTWVENGLSINRTLKVLFVQKPNINEKTIEFQRLKGQDNVYYNVTLYIPSTK